MAEVIQVRMKPNTIDQVDDIKKRVNAPSRSDAIRRAVEISEVIVKAVDEGDKVIIETRDGKQREIIITGLSK